MIQKSIWPLYKLLEVKSGRRTLGAFVMSGAGPTGIYILSANLNSFAVASRLLLLVQMSKKASL